MQFSNSQPIYLQIADYVCEKTLLKEWIPEQRIPSVRELAVQMEVNPNTVMRTFEFLEQQGIIFNQRGIGYFLSKDASIQAAAYRKRMFFESDLPQVFRNLYLLGMQPADLTPYYEQYKTLHF